MVVKVSPRSSTLSLSGRPAAEALPATNRCSALAPSSPTKSWSSNSAKAILATRDVNQEPHNRRLRKGVPRTTPCPFRIVQTPTHKPATHIFILHEGNIHSYRQVFLDGRKHPPDLDPTWYGHSIGWWEKDTLVIDTVG